jgi:long-chain fatty acid transport protein
MKFRQFFPLFLALLPGLTHATSGNTLPRATPEALGMADANVALVAGPSAQFINPANLALPPSSDTWEVGALLGRIRARFDRPVAVSAAAAGRHDAETNYVVIPSAAFAWRYAENIALGLSLESPHGLDTEWPDHTWDRNLGAFGSADIAHRAELSTARLGFAAALRANENWSTGLRVFAQRVEAREQSDLATVNGDGTSVGFQVGLARHSPRWVFGAAYTHRTNTEIKGEQSDLHPAALATGLVAGPAHADILLPARLQVGNAFRMTPDFWWEIDLDWMGWSYVDELTIVQANGTIANAGKNARHNRDTVSIRTGIKWARSPGRVFYAGLGYDPSPVAERDASPAVSLIRKTRIALGAEQQFDNRLQLGVSYQYVRGHTRTIAQSDQDDASTGDTRLYEGTYSSRTHILAIGLRGEF